ncbi:MAG: hypothetical protein HOE90_13100 [Bacteriovoracaceae bacterium]|jgi:caa(3)-type oxidase subunit IV|nr:hypothetical protein [Bacteriovoracaceae bacterium]
MSSDQVDMGHLTPKTYTIIWAILLGLLFLSLFAGMVKSPVLATVMIFGVAIIKAVMVMFYYMHLKVEIVYVKVAVLAGFLALFFFVVGVYPDVVGQFSK